jgi:putative flippase GtrA
LKDTLRDSILLEVFTALKFSIVGIAATILHLLIALSLVAYYGVYPLVANFIAFLCAFMVSFLGNFHWTFHVAIDQRIALAKFFAVTLVAFVVNNVLLMVLLNATSLPKQWAVVVAAMVVPLVTFISSRLWVFNSK